MPAGSTSGDLCGEEPTGPSVAPDSVLGERITNNPNVAPQAIAPAVEAEGAVLPFTGGNVIALLVAALGLIALGFGALRVRFAKK
jgi:hypothetical protein